jgi:hypothetical protein
MDHTEGSNAPGPHRWRTRAETLSLPVILAGLGIVVIAFVATYLHWDRGYLWIDEMFSLRATGGTRSVWDMQRYVLANETNPPLHFWLLYAFRHVIGDPRLAGHALNFVVAVLSVTAIVGVPWRAGRRRLGLLLGIVFLMSASTMSFMQDIRNGFLALSLCGIAIALSGTVRLKGDAGRADLVLAVVVGGLAGISHVYGALFVGCLAAAMVLDAVLKRSRAQIVFGVALGAACVLTFALWFIGLWISAGGHLGSIAWLGYIPPLSGFDLVWRSYFGPDWAWYVTGLGVLLAMTAAAFRRSALVLLICAVGVVSIVAAVSMKMPIVFFRYFLILGPTFHLLLALAVYDLIERFWKTERPGGLATMAALGGCVVLAVPIATGTSDAAFVIPNQDPWWSGIDRVRAEAGACPSHVVRVDLSVMPEMKDDMAWGFTYLLKDTGLTAEDAALTTKDVSEIDCSVVGWAEHFRTSLAGIVPGAPTETDALRLMNLTNKKHVPLKIERHFFGFVIYKAHP